MFSEPSANLEIAGVHGEAESLLLRLSETGGVKSVTLKLGGPTPSVTLHPPEAFDARFPDRVRLLPLPEIKDEAGSHRILTLKRRPRGWSLYLDRQPIAHLPEPFSGPVSISTPEGQIPAAEDTPMPFMQRIGSLQFEDGFMTPPESETPLGNWEPVQGEWGLHVVERSDFQQERAANRVPTAERSPNFFSLTGRGERSLIVNGTEFDDHFLYCVAVQHNSGTNGMVFFYQEETGDFHALTAESDIAAEHVRFVLWRGNADSPERQVLDAFQSDRRPGQWLLLETQVFDDRLILLVDRQQLGELSLPLPPGGQFGLYADSANGARFDDVWVSRHDDVPLSNPSDWNTFTRTETGIIEPLSPTGDPASAAVLAVRDGSPAIVRFGAPTDAARRLSVDAWIPAEARESAGLELGDPENTSGRWRLSLRRAEGNRLDVRLESETNGVSRLRDAFSLPAPPPTQPLRLTLDATRQGEIRGLVNERLIVVDVPVDSVTGSSALLGSAGHSFSWPESTQYPLTFQDQVEDNPQYVEDPFMRHWASPEGQWVTFPDGMTWYRGDAFRGLAVSMPVLSPSELHLAVPSGETNGTIRLLTHNDTTRLYAVTNGVDLTQVAEWPLKAFARRTLGDLGDHPFVTLRLEDHCLWVTSGEHLLWRGHLSDPATRQGTRLRLQGLDVTMLHHVLVRRDAVLDVLFTDSPFDWTLHGGQWEVVNRFACDPRWSHMCGENPEGLAALWSSLTFSGDFCLELFAGMRHGWYDHPGDMNLTVMNRLQTPGHGYTAIVTGWDPDWSQENSRLFRQGEWLHSATNYLAPRRREGSQRRGYEPLLASGRDVHGAWYSMRFRRVEGRLQYSFDNELVYDLPDTDPLTEGGMGIWTYRNSIMVARLRMAAESIRPTPFFAERIPPGMLDAAIRPAHDAAASGDLSLADARHAQTLDPAHWAVTPCPANARLTVKPLDEEPVLLLSALQAGGLLHAEPDFPALPTAQLAGWRFEIALKPHTRVNAALSFGKLDSQGEFAPELPVDYVLSGSAFDRGPRRIIDIGQTLLESSENHFPIDAQWTALTLWLPLDAIDHYSHALFEGFGNLQPSDLQMGIGGNPPGAAYAIRRLEPLWYGSSPSGHALERIGEVVPAPKERDWSVSWSESRSHTIDLHAATDMPPRLPQDALRVNGRTVPLVAEQDRWYAVLPLPFTEDISDVLDIRLTPTTTLDIERTLALADGAAWNPPVLLKLETPGHFRHFARADQAIAAEYAQGETAGLLRHDAETGQDVLRLSNPGREARLQSQLTPLVDLIANPLITFHYRADPLARASIEILNHARIPFTERVQQGGAMPLVQGNQTWQIFHTPVSAWLSRYPLDQARQLASGQLRMRSTLSVDQSGRYAWIEFNRIAVGPAVGPERPLTITPVYAAIDGVALVELAVWAGDKPPESSDQDATLTWKPIPNGDAYTVDLSNRPDGPGWLLLRAVSGREIVSAVTPFPFLLDSKVDPLEPSFHGTDQQGPGTRLDLQIDSAGGSPLRTDRLTLTSDGKSVSLTGAHVSVEYKPDGATLSFDLPPLLGEQLDNASDGQTLEITLDGLADGANNPIPAVHTSYTVDYASDSRAPTLTTFNTSRAPFSWIGIMGATGNGFSQVQRVTQSRATTADGMSYLDLRFQRNRATVTQPFGQNGWNPETHPYLALSMSLPQALPDNLASPVTLVFTAGENAFDLRGRTVNTLSVPLEPYRAQLTPHLQGRIRWTPGHWNDLIVNARNLLRRYSATDKAPVILSITLEAARNTDIQLHLRHATILADWQPDHRVRINAYDASGVKGLKWQNGAQAERNINPVLIVLPEDDRHWLRLQVSDHPGNLTSPLLVPVPTPVEPEPDAPEQPMPDADDEPEEEDNDG